MKCTTLQTITSVDLLQRFLGYWSVSLWTLFFWWICSFNEIHTDSFHTM